MLVLLGTPYLASEPAARKTILIVAFLLFTVFVPVLSSWLLVQMGFLESLEMDKREQRSLPMIFSATSCLALVYLLIQSNFPPLLLFVLFTQLIALILALMVNMFCKLSLHTLGWAVTATVFYGLMAFLGHNFLLPMSLSLVVMALAAWARLYLSKHTLGHVLAGFAVAIFALLGVGLMLLWR